MTANRPSAIPRSPRRLRSRSGSGAGSRAPGPGPGNRRAGGSRASPRRSSAESAIARASGCGIARQALRVPRRRATGRRRATARRASPSVSCRARAAVAAGQPTGARSGLVQSRQRRAPAEHEALGQRVRRQPVRAVHARARTLPDGVQPGERGATAIVGHDSADHVVSRGRDGDRVAAGVESARGRASPRCSESGSCRCRACRGTPCRRRAGARRSRVRPRLSARAPRRSARRRSRGSARPRRARPRSRGTRPGRRSTWSAVGWNCMNSRSASAAPASSARTRPRRSRRGDWWCASTAPPLRPCRAPWRGRRSPSPRSPRRRSGRRPATGQGRSCVRARRCVGARATSSDRRAVRWRPVALPPACTTRRRL